MGINMTDVMDMERLTHSSRQFLQRVQTHPNLPLILAKMSLALKEKKQYRDAKMFAQAAKTLAPKDDKGVHQRYRMSQVMDFDLTPFNRFTPLSIGISHLDDI